MSIIIRLDTNALKSLIDSDENFRLEITNAVLTNITKRYMKSIPDTVKSIVENIVAKERDSVLKDITESNSMWSGQFKLKGPKADEIKNLSRSLTQTACSSMIHEMINEAINKLSPEIESNVKTAVDRVIDNEVRKQVAERIKAVLNKANETD